MYDQEYDDEPIETTTQFQERLDRLAIAGTEPVQRIKARDDGSPLNAGAAYECIDHKGDYRYREDPNATDMPAIPSEPTHHPNDILGAPAEVLMQGPTTTGNSGGGSGRKGYKRIPNAMETAMRQQRRLDEVLQDPRSQG